MVGAVAVVAGEAAAGAGVAVVLPVLVHFSGGLVPVLLFRFQEALGVVPVAPVVPVQGLAASRRYSWGFPVGEAAAAAAAWGGVAVADGADRP